MYIEPFENDIGFTRFASRRTLLSKLKEANDEIFTLRKENEDLKREIAQCKEALKKLMNDTYGVKSSLHPLYGSLYCFGCKSI